MDYNFITPILLLMLGKWLLKIASWNLVTDDMKK